MGNGNGASEGRPRLAVLSVRSSAVNRLERSPRVASQQSAQCPIGGLDVAGLHRNRQQLQWGEEAVAIAKRCDERAQRLARHEPTQ